MGQRMIELEHISKEYTLGRIGTGSLVRDLQSKMARRRGVEDPNGKVGRAPKKAGERFLALNDVGFSIERGERVGIIGANGAGKTTLLKIISRITSPSKGSFYLDGRVASLLEVGTGFHMELTGRENIYLNGAVLGMKRRYIDERLDEIIGFSECGAFIDTPVKRYSSGMLVRLGFAVAAHLDSEILIMDEALAVGDAKFQKKCIETMNRVSREEGRTILYVSHIMPTVRNLCDRGILLEKGEVAFDGAVDTAIGRYQLGRMDSERKFYQFDGVSRQAIFGESKTLLRSLEIKKSDGQELSFRIVWDNALPGDELFFRMTIYHQNGDLIGVADSDPLGDAVGEGKRAEIVFQSPLAPGSYYFLPQILMRRGLKVLIIDAPDEAVAFEQPASEETPAWNHQANGHFSFKKMKVGE